MVTTRNRERANSATEANTKTAATATAGEKHGIEEDAVAAAAANGSPDAKRAKKSEDVDSTRQTTLEETFGKQDATKPVKADDSTEQNKENVDMAMMDPEQAEEPTKEEEAAMAEKVEKAEKAEEADKPEEADKSEEHQHLKETHKTEDTTTNPAGGETAELTHEKSKVPSNILEKGIVYFFFRGRVNTEKTEDVDDIARSYIILRPMATDSKLGDGPIGDAGNTRLLALPKKVLPESGRDRFMAFVEKSGASFKELKEQFLSGADNQTKAGTSHSPAATPAGEGVYVITSTGRENHLAYMLTLPSDLGEVQKELGLKEKGSFILSTKNPYKSGPANASLPETPDFPDKIKEQFRDLRWMPTKPEHLDYANAQVLLIGESSGIEKAVEPKKKDVKQGNDDPETVLQEIEDEDIKRMEHLSGDDSASIFADLQARAKDYPQLQTTF
ncbi:hypothetical protein CH063_12724 [Colletotrichum higginsianum]|uniref:BTB domain transcription factor n=2 Tax=Colletotrichum higginsianum TaxID=80884 RepID=H1VRJ2_COLHI|nr:hypothetical protein CH63R_05035 [Colletotrichum higginsianum IMI 349063]OBR12739.1 hypothetical protein CH63R_05035 [Colletotrichum higginsianum IMI 349063]TID00134.1 hypothetical protein CH35J_005176 [Colletotrichum higginsianum]CCF42848.1 hypothetical protein CH063_12724 [Colletotrichum higginsianum]